MSERSLELAKQSMNGVSKYDYFIVGIGAATFAYFAKGFKANAVIGLNESTFVLFTLLLLALSVISGLKKIERYNTFLEKNGKYLDYSEYLAAYKKNAIEGEHSINEESGEILKPEDSAIKAEALEQLLPKWKDTLEGLSKKICICSNVRDYTLFLSYALLAVSKVLPVL
ncbi:hypothetical protein [Pseudoalteromonas ruthenica]|uniref:hypothetical protein n=1 Tax=Pseudoalteromonas ruthenica TaxID=151081 RepID=UPI0012476985|nr:hypothetical protein [Pseudoalteromonas ruthenica]